MIPMIELLYGVWFIEGGISYHARALERLFLELGGQTLRPRCPENPWIEQGQVKWDCL